MMYKIWRRFLAMFRLSKSAICEESVGLGVYDDHHDYPDSIYEYPWHMMEHICQRCGKVFKI